MPDTGLATAVHPHISDAIAAPSLVRLGENIVLARFETLKVYAALGAVRTLLDNGTIHKGQTLVDSSSGIYALALAMACHRYGLGCHIVASTTVDTTIRVQLEILGATVEQMPPSANLGLDQNRRVARVRALLHERADLHWMRQYHDPVHYLGYTELAAMLRTALPGQDYSVVGSVGTGASTGGLITALRRHDKDTRLVGVQPFGSVTFGSEDFADPEAIIAGIGSSIPFGNVRHELYDQVHWLDFRHASSGAVALLREHAVFAGLSTGAAYLAATWEAPRHPRRTHVVIGADTGHRYTEQVFARHRETAPRQQLSPLLLGSLAELTPPWSVLAWQRRGDPHARFVPTQSGNREPS